MHDIAAQIQSGAKRGGSVSLFKCEAQLKEFTRRSVQQLANKEQTIT